MEVEQWTPIAVAAVLLAILIACVSAVLLVRALVKAGDQPTQGMLVVTLSLLSAGALVGGLAFNSDTALALAGTGFGALAGAVSAMFTSVHTRRDVEERERREEEEDEEEPLP